MMEELNPSRYAVYVGDQNEVRLFIKLQTFPIHVCMYSYHVALFCQVPDQLSMSIPDQLPMSVELYTRAVPFILS